MTMNTKTRTTTPVRTEGGTRRWAAERVRRDEVTRYLPAAGGDFIDEAAIAAHLSAARPPDAARLRDILAKAAAIETLSPAEAATLLAVTDPEQAAEMDATAARVKRAVYDNRIVTFAPLYISNRCVNNCLYCGFRADNRDMRRRVLSEDEIRAEVRVLAGEIGHKRLIVVYGEHPSSDAGFIARTIRTIYDVKVPVRSGMGQIRRVNVNAAPMAVDDLRLVKEAGLGTYQVFQETYHHAAYARLHPAGTPKHDYAWRLTAMHRAFDAGIDDVGIGALFGLADWRFEVMGLLYHAIELERRFGIGPHTISFPRLEPAQNAPAAGAGATRVSDEAFRRAVVALRLAVPYTGMILTARETAAMRRALIPLGITQTDASTRIGLGAYSERRAGGQAEDRQQFMLGDTRSLDELIRDLASAGTITSFCTAGYRCGRTGDKIMGLLKSGREGHFCKLNAVLTFREWLDDFGTPATRAAGEALIAREIDEIRQRLPAGLATTFLDFYARVSGGERDLYI